MWKLEVFSTKIILWQTTNVRRDSGGLQPESHDVKSIGRWAPLVVKILNQNKQQAACKSTTIRFHIFCDSQHLFITWKHGIELKFMESWESCFKDFESKTTTTWFVYRQIHGSMKCVFPHYHWILQGPSENIRVSTKHRSSPNIHRWIWGEHENVPKGHPSGLSVLRGFCPKPLGVYLEPDPIALNYDIYAVHPSDQSLLEGFPISTAVKSQALESPSFTIRYFDSAAKMMLGIKRSPKNWKWFPCTDESRLTQPNPPVTLAYCLSLETNSRSKPTGLWDKEIPCPLASVLPTMESWVLIQDDQFLY